MIGFDEGLCQADWFYMDSEKYGYDITFPELQFSKGTRNYNRILKRLTEINLPNPALFKYSTLTLPELKEYLITILTKILGPEYKEELKIFNDLIKKGFRENPFDAALETTIENDIVTLKKIHISRELASIQVVSTAHEYIHALLAKYNTYEYNKVLSNIHYKELLSILIEYISCYELSQILKEEKLQEKHNIIRLFANQQHAEEHSECQNQSILLNKKSGMINNEYKKYLAYENHNSFGYITSDIYATKLFELYQDDPKTILMFVKRIIEGEKSIKELLTFYNVSLNNPETISSYNKRLENIPKL